MTDANLALKELVRTVRSSSANQSGELRSYAEQNNSVIQRSFKDLYRALQSNSRNTSNLGNMFSENAAETQQVSRRVDATNNILQQTLSIQNSVLVEMRSLNSSFKNLYDYLKSNSGGVGGALSSAASTASNWMKTVVPYVAGAGIGAAAGLGAAALYNNRNQSSVPQNTTAPGSNQSENQSRNQTAVPVNRGGGGGGDTDQLTESVLRTIRQKESNNKYDAWNFTWPNGQDPKPKSTATGAYQFTKRTWKGLTKQFGVGQEYDLARDAPPEIQDQVARLYIKDILRRNNNDIRAVPKEWYAGPKGYLTPDELAVNRGLTVEKYIEQWMGTYNRINGRNENQQAPTPNRAPPVPQSPQRNQETAPPVPQSPQRQQSNQQTASLTPMPMPRDQSYQRPEGGGKIYEDQMREAEVRRLPISQQLRSVLERAASEAGVDVRVKSGGQPAAGSGGKRIGSTRHDEGNAADLDLYIGNRRLSPNNPEDLAAFKKFVATARAAGATGIGAGEGYMAPDASRIHVGFGKEATWGAGGKSANAADWLKESFGEGQRMANSNRTTADLQPPSQSRADILNRTAQTQSAPSESSAPTPSYNAPDYQGAPLMAGGQSTYNPAVDQVALNSGFSPPWIWMLRNAFPSIGGRIMV